MIFFVANDGTIIKGLPSPVYQGSANANTIYLIAPFAANISVTAAFRLPNGVVTSPVAMTPQNALQGIVDKVTGKEYAGWTYALPNSITELLGVVTVQFFFYSAQAGVITATSSTSFEVGLGVPAVLPSTPDEDVYEEILSNLAALQTQLNNGTFTARSVYAWNSTYTYGANEIVFYPDVGDYGAFVKSVQAGNKGQAPYTGGAINSAWWEEVVNFNNITEDYLKQLNDLIDGAETNLNGIIQDAQQAFGETLNKAEAAQSAAEAAKADAQTAKTQAETAQEQAQAAKAQAESFASAAERDAQRAETSAGQAQASEEGAARSASAALGSAQQAAGSASGAAGSASQAAASALSAQGYMEQAKEYAQKEYKIYESFDALPVPGDSAFIYLIPASDGSANDGYSEYLWLAEENKYEFIGSLNDVDLSGYAETDGTYPDMTVGSAQNAANAEHAQSADEANDPNAVHFTAQALTAEQQEQARENIGAGFLWGTAIANETDLDSLVPNFTQKACYYYCGSIAAAQTLVHAPVTVPFSLMSFAQQVTGGRFVQVLYAVGTPETLYTRYCENGAWSGWRAGAFTEGIYPSMTAGKAERLSKQVNFNNSSVTGWANIGHIPLSELQAQSGGYGARLIINGIQPINDGAWNAALSGDVELDWRKDSNTISLALLSGNIPTDHICAGLDAEKITLYLNMPRTYMGYLVTVFSEASWKSADGFAPFMFDAPTYGQSAPAGAVYAVNRNCAACDGDGNAIAERYLAVVTGDSSQGSQENTLLDGSKSLDFNDYIRSGRYELHGYAQNPLVNFPVSASNPSAENADWYLDVYVRRATAYLLQIARSVRSDGAVAMRGLYNGSWSEWQTQTEGGVAPNAETLVPRQLTSDDDLDEIVGAAYWGKAFYCAGSNMPENSPSGMSGGSVLVLRAGGNATVQIYSADVGSSSDERPTIFIRSISAPSTTTWSAWEEIATSDGSYPNLHAGRASADGEGNNIAETYAAKTQIPKLNGSSILNGQSFYAPLVNGYLGEILTGKSGGGTEWNKAFDAVDIPSTVALTNVIPAPGVGIIFEGGTAGSTFDVYVSGGGPRMSDLKAAIVVRSAAFDFFGIGFTASGSINMISNEGTGFGIDPGNNTKCLNIGIQ